MPCEDTGARHGLGGWRQSRWLAGLRRRLCCLKVLRAACFWLGWAGSNYFPPPWVVEITPNCFVVRDANQALSLTPNCF